MTPYRWLLAVFLAVLLAVSTRLHGPAPAPSFRWLPGFVTRVMSDDRSDDAAAQLAAVAEIDDRCSTFDAQAITADLADAPGRETVLASVATGVVLVDARGHRLASAPLADCGGSADGVIALAAGDAWIGAPVIAVVFSSGGRREAETSLVLFRVDDEQLAPIFTGALELREGDELWTGDATLLPGAIWYRPPQGAPMLVPIAPRPAPSPPSR